MSLNGSVHGSGQRIVFLDAVAITTALTAVTTTPVQFLTGLNYLSVQVNFVYGSGGTTAKIWVQTSHDGGATWSDIMSFAFLVASLRKVSSVCTFIAPTAQAFVQTDGTLADDTVIQGTLGSIFRLKYTTTGTYAGTTVSVDGIAKG